MLKCKQHMICLHTACGLWFDLWTQRVVEIKGQWPNRWHCDILRWSAPHLQIAEPDFKSHAYSRHFELLLDKVASTDSGGNQSEHRQPRMTNSLIDQITLKKTVPKRKHICLFAIQIKLLTFILVCQWRTNLWIERTSYLSSACLLFRQGNVNILKINTHNWRTYQGRGFSASKHLSEYSFLVFNHH